MEAEKLVPVGNVETKYHFPYLPPQPPRPRPSWDTSERRRETTEEEERMYWDQCMKSEGFDVPWFPGVRMYVPIVAMDIHDKANGIDYEWYSELAVDEYNRRYKDTNEGELEFVKVLNATLKSSCGFYFFMTLEANDLADHGGKIKTYQAVVFRGLSNDLSVLSFRLKPPEDQDDKQGSSNPDEGWFWKGHRL